MGFGLALTFAVGLLKALLGLRLIRTATEKAGPQGTERRSTRGPPKPSEKVFWTTFISDHIYVYIYIYIHIAHSDDKNDE